MCCLTAAILDFVKGHSLRKMEFHGERGGQRRV